MSIVNQTVTADLKLLSISPLTVVQTKVGPVRIGLVSALISLLLNGVVVPAANLLLHHGFPLPSAGGLSFQESSLVLKGEELLLLTDFAYAPPAMRVRERRVYV